MQLWKPGEYIAWRYIVNRRPWYVQSAVVVEDRAEEIVICFLPGAEGAAEKTYTLGRDHSKRRWDFKENDWELASYIWRTNRVLVIAERNKYYSVMFFWNHARNEFIGYYVNFQLPFWRNHCCIDTLDLDIDIDIEPDLTFMWKDEDLYQQAIEHGAITSEWVQSIEAAKPEILERLKKRKYPFDGTWLDWKPDVSWAPPKLPEGWDKIT